VTVLHRVKSLAAQFPNLKLATLLRPPFGVAVGRALPEYTWELQVDFLPTPLYLARLQQFSGSVQAQCYRRGSASTTAGTTDPVIVRELAVLLALFRHLDRYTQLVGIHSLETGFHRLYRAEIEEFFRFRGLRTEYLQWFPRTGTTCDLLKSAVKFSVMLPQNLRQIMYLASKPAPADAFPEDTEAFLTELYLPVFVAAVKCTQQLLATQPALLQTALFTELYQGVSLSRLTELHLASKYLTKLTYATLFHPQSAARTRARDQDELRDSVLERTDLEQYAKAVCVQTWDRKGVEPFLQTYRLHLGRYHRSDLDGSITAPLSSEHLRVTLARVIRRVPNLGLISLCNCLAN